MTTTVADVVDAVERLWPASGAEGWDAVGLIAGEPGAPVRSIRLAVDAVLDTVDEAIASDADMLIVHHPLLLRGVTSIAADRYKGAVLTRLIRADCAL
ncbi:MAG: Nif3-like dinuclear metal center hexameric protein, partial [Rhodoglobus sp.]|nr:Nif3-like dinuclear metal center hexameric protein [Rhodoglobus sp.]